MKKVDMYIEKYHMLTGKDRVIAGISGGADSVCLLFVLLGLRERLGMDFVAVHVNHGIRGEHAYRDERFVEQLCKKYSVPYEVYHENVESFAKKRKQSVEEAGRTVRREAFEKALVLHGGTKIAMAHHQNDNAETLLLNLSRGTGLKGLGGIRPVAGNIIRPLLCLSRKEIEAYVDGLGCGFCQDETNDGDEYTRNRLRHQVIPFLEQQVNRQAVRHMNETMEQICLLQDYMENQVAAAYERTVEEYPDGSLGIKTAEYDKLHPTVGGLLLREALSKIAGGERDITAAHIEAMSQLFKKQTGRSRNLPYCVVAFRDYDKVILRKKRIEKGADQEENGFCPMKLQIPGITKVPGMDLTISCRIWEKNNGFSMEDVPQKTYTKWFDYDIIKDSLIIRPRQSGDSIAIDKAGKRQKIKSFYINEKIPSASRGLIPLVADGRQILWILGYRMSSAYQVTKQTHRILEINVTEEKEHVRDN